MNAAIAFGLLAGASMAAHTLTGSLGRAGLLLIVGVAAACVDVFSLAAYGRGLQATSSFVIGGTSTVLVLVIGFLVLKEPLTWLKLVAVALIVLGVLPLQREGV